MNCADCAAGKPLSFCGRKGICFFHSRETGGLLLAFFSDSAENNLPAFPDLNTMKSIIRKKKGNKE